MSRRRLSDDERCGHVLTKGPRKGAACVRRKGHQYHHICRDATIEYRRDLLSPEHIPSSVGRGVSEEQAAHGRVTDYGAERCGFADRWATPLGASPSEMREDIAKRGRR